MMTFLKKLFRRQVSLDQEPPNMRPGYIVGMQGKFCSACGSSAVVEHRVYEDFCEKCWARLVSVFNERKAHIAAEILDPRIKREWFGSKFLVTYFTGATTLGFSLIVIDTPAEAMAYALRVAERNGWKLLRVDIQETLTDIFRAEDYQKYFPSTREKEALDYDAERYGAIPDMWAA